MLRMLVKRLQNVTAAQKERATFMCMHKTKAYGPRPHETVVTQGTNDGTTQWGQFTPSPAKQLKFHNANKTQYMI